MKRFLIRRLTGFARKFLRAIVRPHRTPQERLKDVQHELKRRK